MADLHIALSRKRQIERVVGALAVRTAGLENPDFRANLSSRSIHLLTHATRAELEVVASELEDPRMLISAVLQRCANQQHINTTGS